MESKGQNFTMISYIAMCISVDGTTPLGENYREIDVTLVLLKVLPWVPEVFLACSGNFRCWLKAEFMSSEATRKTSGTEWCF